MRTRILMRVSALFMAALGITALFLPQELLVHYGARPDGLAVMLVQAAGALYLGFAMLNWMAQGALIGGIYNRPVALGNFLHFAVVTSNLLKAVAAGLRTRELLIGAAIYAIIAVWFGLVLFTHPIPKAKQEQ